MRADRILVPIDFSPFSQKALDRAVAMVKGTESKLTLLYVHPPRDPFPSEVSIAFPVVDLKKEVDALREALERWAERTGLSKDQVTTEVTTGEPSYEVVERSADFDLVVVSTHGRTGLRRFFLGSVAEQIVRGSKCSVLVVKDGQGPTSET